MQSVPAELKPHGELRFAASTRRYVYKSGGGLLVAKRQVGAKHGGGAGGMAGPAGGEQEIGRLTGSLLEWSCSTALGRLKICISCRPSMPQAGTRQSEGGFYQMRHSICPFWAHE